MHSILKWVVRLVVALMLASLVMGYWKREELFRLIAVNSLFLPDQIVENFSHMDRAFLNAPIPRGNGPVSPLPEGAEASLPDGFEQFTRDRNVTSVVVLKDGAIVYERYLQGTQPDDLRVSWSMAKSYLSALMGVVLAEGGISSLDDRVIDYVPALRDGAYHKATIRNVLNMATGVTFDEDYLDQKSDINRMGRILALGGEMDAFAAGLTDTFAAPGTDWKYVSIDTHVLGMVIRAATGRSIIDLMGDRIITPLGVERTPYYLTDGTGVAFVLGGLNSTTRDYARFGQMYLQQGLWNGKQIVPRDWVLASTTPSAPTDADQMGYGYQWWMPRDARPREYMGRGIYGQYLYINEEAGVVIALTAADLQFRDQTVQRQNVAMFRDIADSLQGGADGER
ncbi:serine hydrolase [uncultured Roseobacter sp.]|uniref:serine hydrolase domain-containing protein n=1 Tax=uncultured Roseobacter sp. TaxID=114847 RepID=UPI0026362695|nr:serine hydrolase [uncultured Roseobacter sp.]